MNVPVQEEFLPSSTHQTGLEVLTTPGTAGDLFRAAQMLPGVSKVDAGAGLFVRGGDVSETVTGLSYSYLRARRRWTRWDERGRYPVPDDPVSADFEIPHTVNLSGNVELPAGFAVGAGLAYASGRPFTPVIGAQSRPSGFSPVYGDPQSERLPSYQRMDVNAGKSFALARDHVLLGYVAITNLLNQRNVFEYAYSPDYSRRFPSRASVGRVVYFGVTFQN